MKMYTLAYIKNGKEFVLELEPMTHEEAITMRSKYSNPNFFHLKDV